jgi:hypothetical protein
MRGNEDPERSRLSTNRLLVHDRQIAVYHLRATFSSLGDGLTAIALSAFVVALARYGLFSLQASYRPVAVSIIASVIAPYFYYVLVRRIAFFRSNSVLADVALDIASARQYVLSIATISCLAIMAALLLPDVPLMVSFFVSFWASLVITVLLAKAFAALRRRISYRKQERLDQLLASRHLGTGLPVGAVGGAAIVFAAACFLDVPVAASIATFTSVALGFWFSPIAYSAVEFERLVGLSPTYSLRTRLRDGLFLAGALTGGALSSLQWQVAGIVLAVFALLLLYKGLEVLMVRAVGGNKAQFTMVLFLFGLVSVVFVLPFSVPLLVPASASWLLAKGRRRTWQLA